MPFQQRNRPVIPLPLTFSAQTYTNLGAGFTESSALNRGILDVTQFSEVRLVAAVSTTGSAGSTAKAMYSTDGTTAGTFTDLGVSIPIDSATIHVSDWATIPNDAKDADALFCYRAGGGDGVADPVIRNVALQFR